MIKEEHLQEEYEFSEKKVMWRISPFIEDDNSKVYYDYTHGNNEENDVFIHSSLSFISIDGPDIHNKSKNSSSNIKMKKRHDFILGMLDTATAMLKNNVVHAAPATNVVHGISLTAPGTNTPTTDDANIIFAPSRKKSDIISIPSLPGIQSKSTTQSEFCQIACREPAEILFGDSRF